MKIGFLRKLKNEKHNKYRHLIFYKERIDGTLDIKVSIPLFLY